MHARNDLGRIGFFRCRNIAAYVLGAALWLSAGAVAANAAHIDIVALGASNTAGKGVGSNNAFPALLEAMLRAKGYDVTVANAGISYATRLGIVSPGARALLSWGRPPFKCRVGRAICT